MNVCHKEYLHEIGFKFLSNSTDLESPDVGSVGRTANIFDLLTSADRIGDMDLYLLDGARLSPFAVIPGRIVLRRVTGWNRIFQLSKRFRLSIRSCIQPN